MAKRKSKTAAPSVEVPRIVRLPSFERGCDGKTNLGRSYAKQADKLAVKHGKKYGVYRCPHCCGTHLTTKLDKSESYAPLIHISESNATEQTTPSNPNNHRSSD